MGSERALLRRLWIALPAVALLAMLIAIFATRDTVEELNFLKRGGAVGSGPVDQSPWQTASTLGTMAVSAEEQAYAREAARLADHEVDQAFAMALRQAGMDRHSASPDVQSKQRRVDALKATLAQDKAAVDAASAAAAKSGLPPQDGDDVALSKAQLLLDTDDLQDAAEDLQRASGDQRAGIQAEAQARDQAEKHAPTGGENAVRSVQRYSTLRGRVEAWFRQRARTKLLAEAETKARDDAAHLLAQHRQLEADATRNAAAAAGLGGTARVKALENLASGRVVLSILDDRAQAESELADVYRKWGAQVWVQHRIVAHLIFVSCAWLMLIVLLAALAVAAGRAGLGRWSTDARRRATLERLFALGVQVLALLAGLLVVFGVPQQTPTILGLATAGLTVVFQDYILAFVGWFVLMGRNGVRVCDWVEINGTGGEVSEIGLFRTTLLETGNWTSRGHPTGRRITFNNSFAIRGTYFNYTTHGQWMWDEIRLTVGADRYDAVSRLQGALEADTARDTAEAEAEWQGEAGRVGLGNFGAAPTVSLRPAASGMEVVVRFTTRAAERFDRRNRIYDEVLRVLQEAKPAEPAN